MLFYQVARSPLLDQLDVFLPQMKSSTQQLLAKSPEELEELDIENTTEDTRVVEMVSEQGLGQWFSTWGPWQ